MKATTTEKKRIQNDESIQFILAGHAHVTFKNRATGNRYTYKVVKSKGKNPVHFVSVLYGSDNIGSYSYIGCIFGEKEFKSTAKSNVTIDDIRFKVFSYVFKNLLAGTLVDEVEVWHEGYCGRCGRLLTVPESVACGFGPECAGKVGITLLSSTKVVKREVVKETVGVLFSAESGEAVEVGVNEKGVIEVECSFDKEVDYKYPVHRSEGGFSGFASDCGLTARNQYENGIPTKVIINVKDYGRIELKFDRVEKSDDGEEVTAFIYSDGKSKLTLFND